MTYDSWRIRFQVSAMHLENTNVDLSIQKNILGGWEDWTSVRDSVPSILRINGKKVGQFYFDYDSQFDELRLTDGTDGGKLRMDTVESFVNKLTSSSSVEIFAVEFTGLGKPVERGIVSFSHDGGRLVFNQFLNCMRRLP